MATAYLQNGKSSSAARLLRNRRFQRLLLITGVVLLARRFHPRLENINWERKFAAMPDDFPPKRMFLNISAVREQNERILELLEADREAKPAEKAEAAA